MPTRVAYQSLPFAEQVAFFRSKLNIPTDRWTDVWRDAHDTGFMVAGAARADILNDFREAVDRAIAGGGTIEEFRKDFDAIVARYGWQYNGARGWRTRVIYETNLRTSYMAGRYAQLTDPDLLRSRPYWRYAHSDLVQSPRPLHLSWDGLILRHDDPWWLTHFTPNGWGCRCQVFAVGERELRRRGKAGPDQAPADGFVQHVDRVTGEVHTVPAGIDPGWDYAPGRRVSERIREQLGRKQRTLPLQVAAFLRETIDDLPPPPVPPPATIPKIPMFSTVRGIDEEGLQGVLHRIEGVAPQMEQLTKFLDSNPVKTVIVKQTEMSRRGRAAAKILPNVASFLGIAEGDAIFRFTANSPKRLGGFTHNTFDNVTVKAKANEKLSTIDPSKLSDAVEDAITASAGSQPSWSITTSFAKLSNNTQSDAVSIWVHEMGHQIHYFAGAPTKPAHLPALTVYGRYNNYEWHAEHFAAWLLNRPALARWSPEVAEYFDRLVERAITSHTKRR